MVTTVKVPDGVESIGAGAFQDCANLEMLELPKSLKWIGPFFIGNSIKMKRLVFAGDAPEGVGTRTLGDIFLHLPKDLVIEVKKTLRVGMARVRRIFPSAGP